MKYFKPVERRKCKCFSLYDLFLFHPIFRYKDGVLIEKNSTCYKMSGYSLAITDVQEKHAGVFTISLGNKLKGLYRNLSYTLVVDGKTSPQTW